MQLKLKLLLASLACFPAAPWTPPLFGATPGTVLTGTNTIPGSGSIINGNSAPQGAALLSASNPAEAMNLHEASILAGTGGTPARGGTPPDLEAALKKNTELFSSLQLDSVPFLVARNQQTGQLVSHSGAMDTAALTKLLGLSAN